MFNISIFNLSNIIWSSFLVSSLLWELKDQKNLEKFSNFWDKITVLRILKHQSWAIVIQLFQFLDNNYYQKL